MNTILQYVNIPTNLFSSYSSSVLWYRISEFVPVTNKLNRQESRQQLVHLILYFEIMSDHEIFFIISTLINQPDYSLPLRLSMSIHEY